MRGALVCVLCPLTDVEEYTCRTLLLYIRRAKPALDHQLEHCHDAGFPLEASLNSHTYSMTATYHVTTDGCRHVRETITHPHDDNCHTAVCTGLATGLGSRFV